jgi:dTDP-4-amino-4,6-dideoxygalactose transaminase
MRWVPPAHSPLHWRDVRRVFGAEPSDAATAHESVRQRFGADAVVLCDSGTTALALALRAASRTHPGPIAIPGYACYDIASALSNEDVAVLPYDIDPRTLGPEPESLARVLRAGARRVVAAPLYGVPLAWDAVQALCHASDALLIEDAAQGSGAEWRGTPHGALGDLSVLSFGRGKGRAAGGGGALLGRGAQAVALQEIARSLAPAAAGRAGVGVRVLAQLALSAPNRFGVVASVPALGIGETHLRTLGEPRALADAQAALVPKALAREAEEIDVRRRHAAQWIAELPRSEMAPRVAPGARAGFLRFPMLRTLEMPLERAERRLGIGAPYPKALIDLSMISSRLPKGYAEPLTGARDLVARLVTLPTHSLLAQRDRDAVSRWLLAQR